MKLFNISSATHEMCQSSQLLIKTTSQTCQTLLGTRNGTSPFYAILSKMYVQCASFQQRRMKIARVVMMMVFVSQAIHSNDFIPSLHWHFKLFSVRRLLPNKSYACRHTTESNISFSKSFLKLSAPISSTAVKDQRQNRWALEIMNL